MEAAHVWYKDGATLVAAAALVVSLISMWHTRSQDLQTAHVDLRAVLQRVLSLALENRERIAKYNEQISKYNEQIAKCKGEAESEENAKTVSLARESIAYAQASIAFVDTLARQEIQVLASQGAKSVRLLGPKLVASPEYLTIARTQEEAGNFEAQADFIRRACETAKTANDKSAALMDSATFLFKTGRVAEGRAEFAKQVEVMEKAPYYAPELLARANVSLQLTWAGMEASFGGDMNAAQSHVTAALKVAEGVGPGPLQKILKDQIDAAVNGAPQGATGAA